MGDRENRIAKKYAQAFYTVFGDNLTPEDVHVLQGADAYCLKNPALIWLLKIPRISDHLKKEALIPLLIHRVELEGPFLKLIDLLIAHGRSYYIQIIIQELMALYYKHNKVESFYISSSHELSSQQKTTIREFLARSLDCVIIDEYGVDQQLIAGIRMQSTYWLWEYSIAKQLAAINRQFGL